MTTSPKVRPQGHWTTSVQHSLGCSCAGCVHIDPKNVVPSFKTWYCGKADRVILWRMFLYIKMNKPLVIGHFNFNCHNDRGLSAPHVSFINYIFFLLQDQNFYNFMLCFVFCLVYCLKFVVIFIALFLKNLFFSCEIYLLGPNWFISWYWPITDISVLVYTFYDMRPY